MNDIRKQKDRVNSIVSEIKQLLRLRTENVKGISIHLVDGSQIEQNFDVAEFKAATGADFKKIICYINNKKIDALTENLNELLSMGSDTTVKPEDVEYITRPIGDIFEINGDYYEVVKGLHCDYCDLSKLNCSSIENKLKRGACDDFNRYDKKNVGYKKLNLPVEKHGVEFSRYYKDGDVFLFDCGNGVVCKLRACDSEILMNNTYDCDNCFFNTNHCGRDALKKCAANSDKGIEPIFYRQVFTNNKD